MSGSGRDRVSKWESKEDSHHQHSSVDAKSGPYYRDKEPEPVRFNSESNGSKRSSAVEDQHPGESRTRSRVAQNNDNNSYYSEQDESRQQFYRRNGSSSDSRSRSRSRSPVYRGRRDAGSSYDRHKPSREFNKRRGDQSSDYGWEDRNLREMKYHNDDFREQATMKGARSSDYNNDFPEDNSRREHLHNGVSDPRLRRHRSEVKGEKDTQRRDGDGEGEYNRSSNIPCKFFAAGFCRNGKHCRFSHHGGERKQHQENNFYRQDSNSHGGHSKWNDVERLDDGKYSEVEVSRASKGNSEPKGNGSSWIDGMEMSPDWNYGAQNLKNPVVEEHDGAGSKGQSSQTRVLNDNLATVYDQRSSGMFVEEKPVAVLHQDYGNSVNVAPVQAFNQNTQNHNVLPYQNPMIAGESQQAATATVLPVGLNLSNPESGKVYQDNHHSTVEKAVPIPNSVTDIAASLAQFLANGQPIPQLAQALQMTLQSEPSMAVQPNQATTALHTQTNPNQLWGLGMSTGAEAVPVVTASHVSNVDGMQTLAQHPNVSENGDKKTDKVSKEKEDNKTEDDTKDAEKVVDVDDDDDDDGSDEDNKKGKDPKEMRAFKFALVAIVKELLKPAWKEGKMNKDGYKNIVKKVVEKVTGTIQSGNVPQTAEKIDHYLAASKPKITKLVQAYISKVKKN